jgi:ribose-phosphate pyrophosphokinase
MSFSNFKIFSGSSYRSFSFKVASLLNVDLGLLSLGCFPDGEIDLQILEDVSGKEVFIIQSLAYNPNFYLMELVLLAETLKKASAKCVVAVIPYLCYTRQDKADDPRVPAMAKFVASLLANAGVDRVITMDLHSHQALSFYSIPVEVLSPWSTLSKQINNQKISNYVVVAPDYGSTFRAYEFASYTNSQVACIHKQRFSANEVKASCLVGDVKGRDVVIVDDICSTASTLIEAASFCNFNGSRKVYAAISHGLFISDAFDKLERSLFEKFFVCNTVPWKTRRPQLKYSNLAYEEVDVSELFACAIFRISNSKSTDMIF